MVSIEFAPMFLSGSESQLKAERFSKDASEDIMKVDAKELRIILTFIRTTRHNELSSVLN